MILRNPYQTKKNCPQKNRLLIPNLMRMTNCFPNRYSTKRYRRNYYRKMTVNDFP